MSTFGKKALVFWNYDSNEWQRFSKTPVDIQLQILKKWYPIGWRCKFFAPTYLSHIEYEIKDYILNVGGFYTVAIDPKITEGYKPMVVKSGYNPLKLDLIDKQILRRDYKLERILKNPS
jgi:hypothetical protein